MDRALRARRLEQARRLLRPSVRIIRRRSRLAERLAQRALAAGDPTLALAITDACRTPSDALRALRRVCLAELDRPASPASSDAPRGLRLAVRQIHAGAECAATRTLRQVLRDQENPAALMLLLSLSEERGGGQGSPAVARRVAKATRHGDLEATATIMLESLGQDAPSRPDRSLPAATIEMLAGELAEHEQAIAPIAAALQRLGDDSSITLLVEAVHRALPRLVAPGAAAESIGEMLLARDDAESARRWAERALELNPFSAIASRLLHRCNQVLYALTPRRLEPAERRAA